MSGESVSDDSKLLKLRGESTENRKNEEAQDLEEQLLEQDIEGNKKRRYQKKSKVDTSQYNDDSSDEDYDARAQPSAPTNGNNSDESDSDMFASDDEDKKETDIEPKVKKPKVEFLDVRQFEKELDVDQNQSKRDKSEEEEVDDDDGDNDDDDDDDDVEEERYDAEYYNNQEHDQTIKRPPKKEPKLDAFNLKQEQNEGRFDIEGNFIRADDSGDEQDNNWLDGIKKRDIKEAKKAQEKREKLQKERQKLRGSITEVELFFNLITLLQPVETPLEALQRLNKAKPKKKLKVQGVDEEEKEKEKTRRESVVKITDLCENLIEKGVRDVYELEREDLMLKYKEESGEQYAKPKSAENKEQTTTIDTEAGESKKWEFRWSGDDKIHGPYGAHEMMYWKGNYFQDRAEVRELGHENFTHITLVSKF